MTTVGAYDAKTNLARLLDEVERGKTITITRHGHPVARLVPPSPQVADVDDVIAAVRSARHGVRRGRSTVRAMIAEGRR